MTRKQWLRLVAGIILIALGVFLLAMQFIPALDIFIPNASIWSLLLLGLGAVFLVTAVLTWTPGLMVPGAALAGLGVLFLWQSSNTNPPGWAFVWTLIPGLVGVGILLMYLMQGNVRAALVRGGGIILASVAVFAFLNRYSGAPELLGQYWSLLLVAGGIVLLAQTMRRRA